MHAHMHIPERSLCGLYSQETEEQGSQLGVCMDCGNMCSAFENMILRKFWGTNVFCMTRNA